MCNHNEVYIKTDKNGTKYYADYTCDRCGGAGGWRGWPGFTCYKCGGTGRQDKPSIRKEYTDEYAAKLEARRQKKHEKLVAERKAELHEHFAEHLAEFGFNADGKLYAVVQKDTYSIKDELKAKGARWNRRFNCWTFTENHEEYVTVVVSWEEAVVENDGGWLEYSVSEAEAKALLKEKAPKEEKREGAHVGNVGDRITVTVTLSKAFSYEVEKPSFWGGYGSTETRYIYKFVDADENVLVWKTSNSDMLDYEGKQLTLKGTVKAHDEYKGEKQTVLTRCKAQ